jgi:hypothetical protein
VPPPQRRAIATVDNMYDTVDAKKRPSSSCATSNPPPTSLPLVLSPHLAKLSKLDEDYEKAPPRPIKDLEEELIDNPERINETEEWLEEFTDARRPYVQLASTRLHAILGLRNERVFDLNQGFGEVEYPQRILTQPRDGRNAGYYRQAENILSTKPSGNPTAVKGDTQLPQRRRSARLVNCSGSGKPQKHNITSTAPKNNIERLFRYNMMTRLPPQDDTQQDCKRKSVSSRSRPLLPEVDRKSGAGLRELLHKHSEKSLVRKRDCVSITFNDLSADRYGASSNKRLGEWSAEREKGERIEVYELDL